MSALWRNLISLYVNRRLPAIAWQIEPDRRAELIWGRRRHSEGRLGPDIAIYRLRC